MSAARETMGIERARIGVGRAGYLLAVMALMAGTLVFFFGPADVSGLLFRTAFGVLLAMPVVNLIAVLVEEVVRRDWTFALIAAGALCVLTYAVVVRL
jgi:hypothetical protein